MKKILVFVMIAVLAGFSGAAQAKILNVGPEREITSIQEAVNDADSGDVIEVDAGTYKEKILIENKDDLSLESDGAVITVPEGGLTGSLVMFVGCENFTFTGFTIDGNNGENVTAGSVNSGGASDTRFYGLFAVDSSGQIADNAVVNVSWGTGAQQGVAIYAYVTDGLPRDIEIRDNTVTNYQKAGISVRGPYKAKISGNRASHWGEPGIIAPNGIQVDGGTGLITGNQVSDARYYSEDYPDWYASAILLMAYSDAMKNYRVVRNTVSSSDVGIAIVDYGAGIEGVNIVNNTFADNLWDTEYSQDGKLDILERASKYQ